MNLILVIDTKFIFFVFAVVYFGVSFASLVYGEKLNALISVIVSIFSFLIAFDALGQYKQQFELVFLVFATISLILIKVRKHKDKKNNQAN